MISPLDVARKLADNLAAHGIQYAIGDALALGYYATPRATVDVDINIFVAPEHLREAVLPVLGEVGFVPDNPAGLIASSRLDGQFRGRVDGVRVDVFVPAFDYYDHLKLMFFRRKDLADAEAILRSTEPIDVVFVRTQLLEFVGADDPRMREWDQLVSDTRS